MATVAAPSVDGGGGAVPPSFLNTTQIPDTPEGHGLPPACWALDISRARPMIAAAANGDRASDWVVRMLGEVRIIDADERIVHLIGRYDGRAGLIGRPIGDFWPPESRAMLAELIVEVVEDRLSGVPHFREVTSIAFDNPVIRAWVGKVTDIVFTSIVGRLVDDRSRWAVHASEERYRNLLHHLPVALLQVDAREIGLVYDALRLSGVSDLPHYVEAHPELRDHANATVQVTDVNACAVTLFGAVDAAQLIGPVGYLFAASPDSALRVMAARFDQRRSHAETMKLRTFDGRLRDVAITVTYPRPPERLDVTLITVEDITDRLATEAQLRQLQADYTRAARISVLGELATSIAHEVNQPLSAIVTNAETSQRWLSRPEPNLAKVDQLTHRIVDSARRASDIVQRIRGMAAPRGPECVPVDLNEIVEESLVFVRHEIETRSIHLSVALAARPAIVLGDRVQLQQVLVNLMLNSVQALAQHGGAANRIAIETEVEANGAVAFFIRDNGPGIAVADLEHVFDSFFTTKVDGIGIGLAICQSLIAAHGGRITAENDPQGGAIFRVFLPLIPAGANDTHRRAEGLSSARAGGRLNHGDDGAGV